MLKVNDYFAGKMKSIGFDAASTGRASVGVMEAGKYTFTTGQPEEMTVVSGALKTLLPAGANDWQVFMPGESFYVPAHSEFCLQLAAETSSYLCRYLSHWR